MFSFANISIRGSVNRIIRKYQARCFPRGSQYSGDFHMLKGIQILFVGLLLSLLFTLPGYTENSKTTFVQESPFTVLPLKNGNLMSFVLSVKI